MEERWDPFYNPQYAYQLELERNLTKEVAPIPKMCRKLRKDRWKKKTMQCHYFRCKDIHRLWSYKRLQLLSVLYKPVKFDCLVKKDCVKNKKYNCRWKYKVYRRKKPAYFKKLKQMEKQEKAGRELETGSHDYIFRRTLGQEYSCDRQNFAHWPLQREKREIEVRDIYYLLLFYSTDFNV